MLANPIVHIFFSQLSASDHILQEQSKVNHIRTYHRLGTYSYRVAPDLEEGIYCRVEKFLVPEQAFIAKRLHMMMIRNIYVISSGRGANIAMIGKQRLLDKVLSHSEADKIDILAGGVQ